MASGTKHDVAARLAELQAAPRVSALAYLFDIHNAGMIDPPPKTDGCGYGYGYGGGGSSRADRGHSPESVSAEKSPAHFFKMFFSHEYM